MKIKKWIIGLLFCVFGLLYSCNNIKNTNNELTNLYQIYQVNDTTMVYMKLYDQWGENSNLGLIEKNNLYLSYFEIDPLPIIKDVNNDTIVLDYYCFKYKTDKEIDTIIFRKSYNEGILKIGEYTIMYHRYYFLYGEGMLGDQIIDSIYFDKKTLKVSFYNKNEKLKELFQKDVFYIKDKKKFCYFKLDTIKDDINWYYLSPKNKIITEGYFRDVFRNLPSNLILK